VGLGVVFFVGNAESAVLGIKYIVGWQVGGCHC